MLRCILLGALAFSTFASCSKHKDDAPKVAVGTAAGKVIEVSGKVTATREGKTRDLVVGGEVFGDDQVATSADSTITIELFHNGAHWSVIANKTARVDGSLAWGLDKQAAAKTVEHNSAAAGREAERSAAETAATATEQEEKKEEAPKVERKKAEPAPAAQPMAPTTESMPAPGGAVPPPPPPPPPVAAAAAADENEAIGGKAAPSGGGGASKAAAPKAASKPEPIEDLKLADQGAVGNVITAQELAEKHRDDFKACIDPKHAKVTFTIKVPAKGTLTVKVTGDTSAKVKTCAIAAAKKVDWLKGVSSEATLKFE